MSGHTPGPWEYGKYHPSGPNRFGHFDITQTGEMYIHARSFASGPESEGQANARLIAAAPELLAALRMALKIIEHPDVDASEEAEIIRDTITKATSS